MNRKVRRPGFNNWAKYIKKEVEKSFYGKELKKSKNQENGKNLQVG